MRFLFFLLLASFVFSASTPSVADAAAFDLNGPPVEITVTRAGNTLPIAEVPNLQTGDRIWLHPELPPSQSVHYLLVAAFLRGTTNPPPEEWFTKAETWTKAVREEGIVVTVPKGAQQMLLFLAPETGGDFSSLRTAVRGKPGAFVRASQDLVQASLNRSRLDKYLQDVRQVSESDPHALHDQSVLLARSLSIKLDQQCFDRPIEQQMACLTHDSDNLVLDDGHSQSMVATLTSGPASDLIGHVSSTPMARGGYYSPYIGAFVDVARIMSSIHTAQYQYIPALALPKREELKLKLNNPPSFRNPKSVIVIGMPAVEAEQLPPLRPVDANQVFCLQSPTLALAAEGAPLVFSTDFAHDFVLQLQDTTGRKIDIPVSADPARGGFVTDPKVLAATLSPSANLGPVITASLHGYWGFKAFDGPTFQMRNAHSATWMIPGEDSGALIVGRGDTLHLLSTGSACVQQIVLKDQAGKEIKAQWQVAKADELKVQVPLEGASSGPATLLVKQFGLPTPDKVALQMYSEAARLDGFTIHVGDHEGLLHGTRLDEVATLELPGAHFAPGTLSRSDEKDELKLSAAEIPAVNLKADEKLMAQVALKDGRVLKVQTKIEPPRPKVVLLNKNIQPGTTSSSAIRMGKDDELPQDGRLSFFVKSEVPQTFQHDEKIEVATKDDSYHVLLSQADGGLVLQDSQTILAFFDPAKAFGPSAFGELSFRVIAADGAKGDWLPLATLVRTPALKDVHCPSSPDKGCMLTGTNLYLIDSVASDAEFTHNQPVPLGAAGSTLPVPRPNGTLLYMKLRDDPSTVDTVVLPVLPE